MQQQMEKHQSSIRKTATSISAKIYFLKNKLYVHKHGQASQLTHQYTVYLPKPCVSILSQVIIGWSVLAAWIGVGVVAYYYRTY